jgi:hypothetical protein
VNNRFTNTSLGQQLAILTAGLCLLMGLALVILGAISTRHMQTLLQEEYGSALATLVATRVSTAMESSDLLSVSASLQRIIETSAAQAILIQDVEGKTLRQMGETNGQTLYQYSAPVHIETDIAGEVVITINAENAHAAQLRFILSMLGLAVLLSLAVYGVSRRFGQQLGNRLSDLSRKIALEEEDTRAGPTNELLLLSKKIEALPMDLLRTRSEPSPQDENYQTTAVLYLHLSSLEHYVDTLDELSLQRYTDRLHQVVYAAAGFYAGDLQVARQFGLAVYFSGHNTAQHSELHPVPGWCRPQAWRWKSRCRCPFPCQWPLHRANWVWGMAPISIQDCTPSIRSMNYTPFAPAGLPTFCSRPLSVKTPMYQDACNIGRPKSWITLSSRSLPGPIRIYWNANCA